MFCSNCGKEIRTRRAEFCPFCGGVMEKDDNSTDTAVKAPAKGKFGLSRKAVIIASAVGAALLVIVIAVLFHSAGLGSWKCDRCDDEWFGRAYRGRYAGSTLCENCAEDYWSPRPLEDYLRDADW